MVAASTGAAVGAGVDSADAAGVVRSPQLVAQLGQQRIVRGAGQIAHLHRLRQSLATGRAHRDQGPGLTQGPGGHHGLGAHLVAGIDAVYASAVQGKGGMPARGGTQASDADLRAAVEYMAAAAK